MLNRFFGKKKQNGGLLEELFPYEDDAFYQRPYAYYQRLREQFPFYEMADGTVVLSRAKDIRTALGHPLLVNAPSRFSSLHASKRAKSVCADVASNIMPFLDGPKHKSQRRAVAKVFQTHLKRMSSKFPALARGYFEKDLSKDFRALDQLCTPFAMEIICELLGLSQSDHLQEWSTSFFYLFTKVPSLEVKKQVDTHLGSFRKLIKQQMSTSETGVLVDLRKLVEAGELEEAEAIDTVILLFADGLENVDSGLANLLLVVAANTDLLSKIRERSLQVEAVVEEVLRFESPAHYIARTVSEHFVWNGLEFKAGSSVILLLGSANRDEEEWEDAHLFVPSRDKQSHLVFGLGAHSCLGGDMVRLEMVAFLNAMAEKLASVAVQGSVKWQNRKGHRWPEDFKVSLQSLQ